jgi:hypothetical protein
VNVCILVAFLLRWTGMNAFLRGIEQDWEQCMRSVLVVVMTSSLRSLNGRIAIDMDISIYKELLSRFRTLPKSKDFMRVQNTSR